MRNYENETFLAWPIAIAKSSFCFVLKWRVFRQVTIASAFPIAFGSETELQPPFPSHDSNVHLLEKPMPQKR